MNTQGHEVIIKEYFLFLRKLQKELERYHRGKGIALSESISDPESNSVLSCLTHTKQLLRSLAPGQGNDWVDKILKKTKSWMRIFECLSAVEINGIYDVADSLIDGSLSLDEAILYAS